ncbi:MAG: hypothetical protein A2W22_03105 [Candidatus Levybacteria bacterium RBG_16_35_11]|nr:MAG: hypothetical protein A2W22_03105 [Candidatus Levybacteria bacterium RBG_16_35_11]
MGKMELKKMSYKPQRIKSDFAGSPVIAKVRLNESKTKVQVVTKGTDESPSKTFVLAKEDCPEHVTGGEFIVQLTKEKDKMLNMHPVNGMFWGKVSGFPASKDKPPTIRRSTGEFPYDYFLVLVEISQGEYKGMSIPYALRYHFTEATETINGKEESVVAIGHLKSKYTPPLEDFCEATGIWTRGAIRYSDNILTTLQKRILREAREFQFVLKDGWVNTVFVPETEEKDEPEPSTDEEEMKKKFTPQSEPTPEPAASTPSEDEEIPFDDASGSPEEDEFE